MKYWVVLPVILAGLLLGCPGKNSDCQCGDIPKSLQNKYVGGSCKAVTLNPDAPPAQCFYNSEKCCIRWGYKWSDPASWGSE